MANVGADVKVNFKDVQYTNGAWVGTPSWDVQKVSVHPGTNTITWNLKAQNVPAGFTPAFSSSAGIAFSGVPTWIGGTPALQPDGTYQCADNFIAPPTPVDYYYGVQVVLTPNGTNAVPGTFNYDPQVENESN
jgi:hypothetical protein